MTSLPQPVTDALLSVAANKHVALIKVQTAIVRAALEIIFVSPSDIPEDICCVEDRQGVASNAWNGLRALDIIEPVERSLTNPEAGIFGGRVQNTNPKAKGRWVACYQLKNRAFALAWLRNNKVKDSNDK